MLRVKAMALLDKIVLFQVELTQFMSCVTRNGHDSLGNVCGLWWKNLGDGDDIDFYGDHSVCESTKVLRCSLREGCTS
jgi:hypothetical protein